MSAQLSTYKRFLSKYATKLETVIARFKDEGLETVKFSDEETTDLSIREKQRLLEEGIGAIETCNAKVQEILQNYAIALDKYGSLSDKEVEDFEQYSNRTESVLCASHDYIVLLKARLNAFTSYPATCSMHKTSNNGTEHEGALGVKKMELPTLPIPTFYGDLWEWDNFWTLFDANVNSQPLPELYKFNYLIKALKGEPLQAIKRFRVSQENYEKAVNFLKTKYGDKEQLINRLYERLERLQLKSPSIRDQRKLLEQIQAMVTQLQEKNEHVDNQCTIKQVLSKFPNKLQRKVLERKYTQPENTFGMETLLKLLEEFITTEEKVSLFTREAPKPHPTSPTFLRRKEEPTRWINKCMYCGQDHKAIACTKYTTPQSRAQYLREHKLCLICASTQHTSTECSKRMCFICQGPHHTSCCFKYDPNRTHTAPAPPSASPPAPPSASPPAPSSASPPAPFPAPPHAPRQKTFKQIDDKATQGPQRRQTKTKTPSKIHQINEAKESEGTICELQRENRKNSVGLPMGQLQVMDPNTKNLRKIPVLLDTGAELSFIDSNLAEELHLPTIKTTKLRLSTFGSNKVNETVSRKVELDAWDAETACSCYMKLCTRYVLLAKWLERFPYLPEDPERPWLEELTLMDMLFQKEKMDKIVDTLSKQEAIVTSHIQAGELLQKEKSYLAQINRLKDRLRDAEDELFEIKAKKARKEHETQYKDEPKVVVVEKEPEVIILEKEPKKLPQVTEKRAEPMDTNDDDVPRLVDDDDDEEWEEQEDLIVLDEEEGGEEQVRMEVTEAQTKDKPQDEPEQMVQLEENPQREPEQAACLVNEPQRGQEQVAQPNEDEQYLAHMIAEANEVQQVVEPPERQGEQPADLLLAQELQNKIEELKRLREDLQNWQTALQRLPRRLLQDLTHAPHVPIECAFCGQVNRHFSDSCPVVTDGDERFRIVRQAGLCHRCLLHCRRGRCRDAMRTCFYCDYVQGSPAEEFRPNDRGHHKALCTVPNAEGIVQRRIRDARERYYVLEQEMLQLRERQDGAQRAPTARRPRQH